MSNIGNELDQVLNSVLMVRGLALMTCAKVVRRYRDAAEPEPEAIYRTVSEN